MRARFYNPYLCRFLNADPSGFSGGLNHYAYADGNPVSMIDPFGLGAGEVGGSSWLTRLGNTFDKYIGNPTEQAISYGLKGAGDLLWGALTVGDNFLRGKTLDGSADSGLSPFAANLIAGAAIGRFLPGGGGASAAETTAALSPYRMTRAGETFSHYGYAENAASFQGGLRPGGFATSAGNLSGVEAQSGLALPRPTVPPNAVYTVTPEAGTWIRANPVTRPQFGQPGGLPEYQFPGGTGPGTVSPPRLIP